jgi:hypothetical protein
MKLFKPRRSVNESTKLNDCPFTIQVAGNIGGSLMSLGNKEKKNIKKLAKSVTHKVSITINNVFKAARELVKQKMN